MQMIYTDEEIKAVYEVDATLIVKAFEVSKETGTIAIRSALDGFRELLNTQKGEYVPAMDLDHRRYIIGLLGTTLKQVDDDNRVIVFQDIVFPK